MGHYKSHCLEPKASHNKGIAFCEQIYRTLQKKKIKFKGGGGNISYSFCKISSLTDQIHKFLQCSPFSQYIY